jgi:hypothetical protein
MKSNRTRSGIILATLGMLASWPVVAQLKSESRATDRERDL